MRLCFPFWSLSYEGTNVYNIVQAKLSSDVAEMTRQLQLIESKFVELTTRLHLKDLEIADLERAQKVLDCLEGPVSTMLDQSNNLSFPSDQGMNPRVTISLVRRALSWAVVLRKVCDGG